MRSVLMMFSSALLLGSVASALSGDPFVRGAPPQSAPSVQPPPAGRLSAALPSTPASVSAAPGKALPLLGAPRVYSEGSQTKVVYDLPAGVSYTLTPNFGGLKLEFRGLKAQPSTTARLGVSVGEYRVTPQASGASLSLATPFSLSAVSGWRATEATIAAGSRVLILEFGPAISGGQLGRGAPTASAAPEVTSLGAAPVMAGAPLMATPPQVVTPDAPVAPDQLAPGDSVGPLIGALPAPAAPLPGAALGDPNVVRGRADGAAQSGVTLSAPRIGKNPGVTRVVLDLPAGSSFKVTPGALGLGIELSGVSAQSQNVSDISPELRGWRYQPGAAGNVSVFLLTASPLNLHSGWRSVFLPPAPGSDRSRLAIDLSPAYANLTPLAPGEKVLAAVPPLRASTMRAFSGLPQSAPSVVLDPGHGGIDPGAVGMVTEKVVNLDVALRVRSYLQAAGVNVIMTRDTDRDLSTDKATDLNARAALGYNGAQLYVSIHANSMPPVNILRGYGVETWWNNNHPASSTLANLLQTNIVQTAGAYSQGLKTGRSLAVLRGSRVPAALVEIGYVGHPVDGTNLQDTNYLDRVALGIAKGIREALVTGLQAPPPNLRN